MTTYLKEAFKNGGQLIAYVILLLALREFNLLPLKAGDFESWNDYVMLIIMLSGMIISLGSFLIISVLNFKQYIKLKSKELTWKLENYSGEEVTLDSKVQASLAPMIKTIALSFLNPKVEEGEEEEVPSTAEEIQAKIDALEKI